jgi:hypothetical protein
MLFVVVLLVGLSAGAIYVKRVVDAPDEAFQRGLSEPLETDWVACCSRGSRDSSGRSQNRCASPIRKTREMTTSWCRERGYDSRRLFEHRSAARSWVSENCH